MGIPVLSSNTKQPLLLLSLIVFPVTIDAIPPPFKSLPNAFEAILVAVKLLKEATPDATLPKDDVKILNFDSLGMYHRVIHPLPSDLILEVSFNESLVPGTNEPVEFASIQFGKLDIPLIKLHKPSVYVLIPHTLFVLPLFGLTTLLLPFTILMSVVNLSEPITLFTPDIIDEFVYAIFFSPDIIVVFPDI